MKNHKTIIFLGDGMADEPMPELGGRTPLQQAHTPTMDAIARRGRSGTLFTLPEAFPTSSEVANMSVLGCDLATEYCGRGPMEAAGRGIELAPDQKAFRLNLTTVEDGILRDYSAGHLGQGDAEALIAALDEAYGSETVRFHAGVSFRSLLLLSGADHSARVKAEKPDDNQGNVVAEHLPHALAPEAEATAALFVKLMTDCAPFLEAHPVNQARRAAGKRPANGLWPWSGGSAGALKTLRQKYGLSGAVISAVDVINGLGKLLGMDVIRVEGATGYIDTNYEGKADAAIEAIKTHDMVYVHVEATDEVSHEQDLPNKLKAIEDFDQRLMARVMDAVGGEVNAAVLPDHPVPLALGKHTRVPVPVSVVMAGVAPDGIQTYDEIEAPRGALGAMAGSGLMDLLFGPPSA